MKATQPHPGPEINWQARCQIALSLANNTQRDPARNLELIRAALQGATVEHLFHMERLGVGAE